MLSACGTTLLSTEKTLSRMDSRFKAYMNDVNRPFLKPAI